MFLNFQSFHDKILLCKAALTRCVLLETHLLENLYHFVVLADLVHKDYIGSFYLVERLHQIMIFADPLKVTNRLTLQKSIALLTIIFQVRLQVNHSQLEVILGHLHLQSAQLLIKTPIFHSDLAQNPQTAII